MTAECAPDKHVWNDAEICIFPPGQFCVVCERVRRTSPDYLTVHGFWLTEHLFT